MITKTFSAVCLLLMYCPLPAQDRRVTDSLYRVFHAEKDLAQKADLLYYIANEQDDAGNPDDGFRLADSIDLLAKAARYEKGRARACDIRGWAYKNKGAFSEALPYFHEQLAIFIKLQDLEGQGRAYNNIGGTWSYLQTPDSAVVYLLKGLTVKEKTGNKSDIAGALANIANAYNDMDAHDKAIEMHHRVLRLRRELGEEKRTMFTYNNIMVAYGTKGDAEKAIAYADSALALATKYNNKMVTGVVCGGMGHILNQQKRYRESLAWCERSMAYLTEVKREQNMVYPLCNMATAYNGLGQYAKALEVNQRGWAIMQKLNLQEPLDPYHENFANAYAGLRDFENAYKWHKIYFARLDTINKKDYVGQIANIEAKYNLVKKEQEITAQRAANYRQSVWLYSLSAAFAAFIVFGYLFWNRYRLRKRTELDAALIREQKLGLNAVIEAQEAERKRIAKDLHDSIAQELVALKLGFNALGRRVGKSTPEEIPRFAELDAQLDASCKEVRSIAHTMSPPTLEQQGLAPSLELLLRNSLHPKGIETRFEYQDVPDNLSEKVKVGVYRIAQELINNIVKHADAHKVLLRIGKNGPHLEMLLQDDGKGYDFEDAKTRGSMGLLNIISRVNTLNGSFSVDSVNPHGSLAQVRIMLSV
jgi:signal transduction histidine kinase